MRRQLTTTTVHHKTADYQVATQTGARTEEINVINLNTGKTENYGAFDSVEKAVAFCDRMQRGADERRAKLAEQRAAEEKAQAERAATEAEAQARGPLATDRQVSYIMSLLAQTDGQNFSWFTAGPTDPAEIAKMTRRDASTYIDALKNN